MALVVVVAGGAVLADSLPDSGVPNEAEGTDVVTEDQAVAALGLYAAEVAAVDDLGSRGDPFAPPGPGDAARAAGDHADAVAEAIATARAEPNPDPLAADYWDEPAHEALVTELRELQAHAEGLALLAGTHDTVYTGAGAVDPQEAQQALTNRYGSGEAQPGDRWAQALLAELDGTPAAEEASRGRDEAGRQWQAAVDALSPAAVDALRASIAGLPPSVRDALTGHPVAGPALERLDR